jgi:hypothetical protein
MCHFLVRNGYRPGTAVTSGGLTLSAIIDGMCSTEQAYFWGTQGHESLR